MTCFLGVTNFDKPTSQGATSTDPSGDPHDHLAVHCDTAERSISPSRSPGTIEDVNCDPPEMCIDSTRFSASDVLDLKKTEDKRLGISEHGSGPPFSQGTTSPTSYNVESNPSGVHIHTLDGSTPLCRSSGVPRETEVQYRISVSRLKPVKLDDQRL